MTINISIDVPDNMLGKTLLQLAQVFGQQPLSAVTVDPQAEYKKMETTVGPAPKNMEKAVKPTEVKTGEKQAPQEKTDGPAYSITTIRAKAKEVAGVKGNDFIRECLEAVGATSLSGIAEDKFGEFMDVLTAVR